jgi:hypothetical protein
MDDARRNPGVKTLVAGWFSFEQMGASAGDLMVRDLTCQWLDLGGHSYDVALAAPFSGGVDWRDVDPADYANVVFVCGPVGNGPPLVRFLERFEAKRLLGLNLTMLEPLESWNPFHYLLERDSSATARPDMTFLAESRHVPVVGVIRIDAQPEYKQRDRRETADAAIGRLLKTNPLAAVPIDTRLDENQTGLRTAAEVESLIACMDMVITTRLHGMVLALKNGVPALAIDSVAGGDKISRQAQTIGWRTCFLADTVDDQSLQRGFEFCLTKEAKAAAHECREHARRMLADVREQFLGECGDAT